MIRISTFDDQVYDVSEETAEAISQAMATSQKHFRFKDTGQVLAIANIKRMDPFGRPRPQGLPSGSVIDDDFYSEEAISERRAENKLKYKPRRHNA